MNRGIDGENSVRTIVLWCPDWPVIAAEIVEGVPATAPVAVVRANRVLATSPAARAEGVRRGLRKREAQGRCPHLIVLDDDPLRDTRAYEPVLTVVEALVCGVEVVRPGVCAIAARGPARYFGGEQIAAERLVEQVAQRCDVEAQAGIADGVFAAGLAARSGLLVPAGETAAFLSGLAVAVLGRPVLADLLRRLGIRTLAEFAALPAADVLARFGFDAALAHRLAAGRDDRPLRPRTPPPDLAVVETFDDPLERVDAAAFAARTLAERLNTGLTIHGLACTRLAIEARTAAGEELHRTWRHEGLLTPAALAERVRWQLDGWLTSPNRGSAVTPTTGITLLRLTPEGVVTHAGSQPGLWGEAGEERDRAHRAITRVQGLLGPEAVFTAVLGGGRGQADQVRLVPFGDERVPTRPKHQPWPGQLPAPAPATLYPAPLPAMVYGADRVPVAVTGRLRVTGVPTSIVIAGAPSVPVTGWAGPWPVDERWWAAEEANRYARFQLLLADGQAMLMTVVAGRWRVVARYD